MLPINLVFIIYIFIFKWVSGVVWILKFAYICFLIKKRNTLPLKLVNIYAAMDELKNNFVVNEKKKNMIMLKISK